MKAILTLEMPKNCGLCPISNNWMENGEQKGFCPVKNDGCNFNERPSWCPLKPIPEKKVVTVKRIDDIQSYSITEVADKISAKIILKTDEVFTLGWNACLEALEDSHNGEDSNE